MSRAFRDILTLAGVPTAIALAVLVLGATLTRTSAVGAAAEPGAEQLWPASECHTTTVVSVRGPKVGGGALLCVASDAIRPALYVTGLTPGVAYSVWMLSFDRLPDARTEMLADDTRIDLHRADAFGRLKNGVALFDGTVHVQSHVDGQTLASGSRVMLLLVDDGAGRASSSQLGSVVGYARFTLP